MHPFFQVLAESLHAARVPEGSAVERILFRVLSLEDERVLVELGPAGCRVLESRGEDVSLTVFCDRAQLDSMLKHGFTERPLRFSGNRALFDRLAALAKPPVSWIEAQRGRT